MTQIPSETTGTPSSSPSSEAVTSSAEAQTQPQYHESQIQGPYLSSSAGSGATSSSSAVAVSTAGAAGLATTDEDDGFTDSVPFQALSLKINRSRGFYQLDGDERERTEVLLIPRAARTHKSYFGLPYDPKTPHEPSCASPDGVYGFGWVDAALQDDVKVRTCATCIRKGYGAGACDDLKVLFGYDLELQVPVLVYFKNAETSAKNGVFTLAVNRMRTLAPRAVDTMFKLGFTPGDGPYSKVTIDVAPIGDKLPTDKHAEVAALLDAGWAAWKADLESRGAELRALAAEQGGLA